jgi:CHASE3 domain sensor protein
MNPNTPIIITSQEFDELPLCKKEHYEPNNKIHDLEKAIRVTVDYIHIEYRRKRDEDAIVDIMQSDIITAREYNKLTNELRAHFEPHKTKKSIFQKVCCYM